MSENPKKSKIKDYLKFVFMAICIFILIDTYIPGKTYEGTIKSISINYESYFNAAGNGHDSYAIVTENHSFYIDEEEKDNFSKGANISYRLSPIFNEVQQFESDGYQGKTSSLRLYTGTIFPLLFLSLLAVSFKLKDKMSILVFVIQVGVIGELIYLLN